MASRQIILALSVIFGLVSAAFAGGGAGRVGGAVGGLGGAVGGVGDAVGGLGGAVGGTAGGTVGSAVGGVGDAIGSAAGDAGRAIGSVGAAVGGLAGSTGTSSNASSLGSTTGSTTGTSSSSPTGPSSAAAAVSGPAAAAAPSVTTWSGIPTALAMPVPRQKHKLHTIPRLVAFLRHGPRGGFERNRAVPSRTATVTGIPSDAQIQVALLNATPKELKQIRKLCGQILSRPATFDAARIGACRTIHSLMRL